MLAISAIVEGFLFTVVLSSGIINADGDKLLNPTIVEMYEGISKANISKRNAMNFGNQLNYFQGKFSSTCKTCGLGSSENGNFMIINGDIVQPPYKYPFMVQLVMRSTPMCGGVLLNEYYILTAAHCLTNTGKPFDSHLLSVRFTTDTYKTKVGPKIEKIIIHPQYSIKDYHKNDIGLVKLKSKITCDKFKNPVCLPPANFKLKEGEILTAAGWGLTEKRKASKQLLEARIKHVNYKECRRYFLEPNYMAEVTLCVEGLSEKWQMICDGDSGGPAFIRQNGKFYVMGLTSKGEQNCRKGSPGMFTLVPKYVNWINKVMSSE